MPEPRDPVVTGRHPTNNVPEFAYACGHTTPALRVNLCAIKCPPCTQAEIEARAARREAARHA